ncbi:MAG TPA: hypothetical protein PLN53_08085 [Terricaulis sp.]|nr:hypothetical protein [Terricaulis sp.]
MNLILEIAAGAFFVVFGIVLVVRHADVGSALGLSATRLERAKFLGYAAILVGVVWILMVAWPA